MKRSDRHKPENQTNKSVNNNSTGQKNTNTDDGKFSKYVNKDKLDKGKKFFSGKLSSYNTQLKHENKILKEKFTSFRSGESRQERDPNQKRPIIPIIVTGILLLPITILLAFLLITNFLPDESDMNRIASNDATDDTEEIDRADEETGDGDTDVAVVDDEDDVQDVDVSEDIPEQDQDEEILSVADYSTTERQQLQRAAQAAVNEKNAEIALVREREAAERARQQRAEEARQQQAGQTEETEEEDTAAEDTDTEDTTGDSEPPTAGNAVHVVSGEDNLYRIAIQYYGDGSAANVQRIRDANGLSGDNLSLGQELIIP